MRETITDWTGKPIAVKIKKGDKTIVTDWTGRPKGTADERGTRGFTGKPISQQNADDLLIKKGKK